MNEDIAGLSWLAGAKKYWSFSNQPAARLLKINRGQIRGKIKKIECQIYYDLSLDWINGAV